MDEEFFRDLFFDSFYSDESKKIIYSWNQRIKHRVFLAGQGQGKTTFLKSIFDCMCRKIPPTEYQSQPHHIVNPKYIDDSLYTNIYDDIAIDHFDGHFARSQDV